MSWRNLCLILIAGVVGWAIAGGFWGMSAAIFGIALGAHLELVDRKRP